MDVNQERTWLLSIHITDLSVDKTLRVSGDLHVGGVMFKLVESLVVPADWSDHALWWPEKCIWLSKSRVTLNQYGVHADAKLQFTPMHKTMKMQLPDLQLIDLKIDFSVNVFNAVIQLCKEMGVRHPEELSLLRPNTKSKDKKSATTPNMTSINRNSRISSSSNGSINKGNITPASPLNTSQRTPLRIHSPGSTLAKTPMTPQTPGTPGSWVNGMSPQALTRSLSFDEDLYTQLVHSPRTSSKEAFQYLRRHKSLTEKAAINGCWLDSNKSLMEQQVHESDLLYLKFKYFFFYDLNPKYDPVRINQIYEQAKWSLISEEIDCTDEEMLMFAALQLQVECQSQIPILDEVDSSRKAGSDDHDDIDAALNDLQVSLEGSTVHNTGDITHVPELQEYIKHFKPRKYTIKGAKRYYALLRDTQIYLYKSEEDTKQKSLHQINLRDCEIQPDVNMSSQKFVIKLFIPGPECITEEWLRCDNEEQYARWMAACKLGSKGHTMADSSYNAEVRNIEQFLSLQKPCSTTTRSDRSINKTTQPVTVSEDTIDPANFMASRCLKKNKAKLAQKMVEAHGNVSDMPLVEAKLNYIKAWQALPEYGLTYFVVKFRNNKKEELVGIGYNRLIRINPKTSEVTKTYRFSSMSSWSVHWENREVIVDFEEEKLAIKPLSADCKVFHEFLGGYIYLSMRSQDKNEALNEDMFYKLTSGNCG